MPSTASDILAILAVLRRQWKLIALTVVLFTAAAAAYTYVSKPLYTASTLVLVDPTRKNLLDPDEGVVSNISENLRVESEVQLAGSDTVLMRAIADLGLVPNSEFTAQSGLLDQIRSFLRLGPTAGAGSEVASNRVLEALRATISVDRRNGSFLLSINVRSNDPARAAEIANALAASYIREQIDSKIQSVQLAREALDAQLIGTQRALTVADGAVDQYIVQSLDRLISDPDNEAVAIFAQSYQDAKARQARAQASLLAEQAHADRASFDAAASNSAEVRELAARRAEIAGQLAALASGSAEADGLQAQLTDIDQQMAAATARQIAALREEVVAAGREAERSRDDIRAATADGSSLSGDISTALYGLQQEAQLARAQYNNLLARSQDLDAQASLQLPDSRVVSPALTPAAASSPNPRTNLILGLLAGLAAGLGLAFLYENYVGGFTSEDQATSVLGLPINSAVPRLRRKDKWELTPADLIAKAPLSAFTESIRRITIGVDQALGSDDQVGRSIVLMVTSALPGEGKSTVALALARSYAMAGRKTLLVDGDLRKPTLHRILDIQPKNGLLDYFANAGTPFDDLVRRDPKSDAVLLLGARPSSVDTHQIVSDRGFGRLLHSARHSFDVVIVDTSPLGPVVDGLQIAKLADAMLFIVKWGSTRQQDAKKALNALQAVTNGKPALLVLNQEELASSDYLRRYGSYYLDAS